jgi:tRNA pseudouridine38-40 synthase
MSRIKMQIEYDGSRYHGFQRQNNAHTIQAELEAQILRITGEAVTISGAGRTDAGVHARGQVIAFNTSSPIPPARWTCALNSYLPPDIQVLDSQEVEASFHPAFQAVRKRYSYHIYRQRPGAVFFKQHALLNTQKLDLAAMQSACQHIEGYHDFRAFCSAGATTKTFDRTVYSCELSEVGPEIILDIEANGFLYNMVRIIMGTLLEVGKGRILVSELPRIIAGGQRALAGPTAPPQGLYLMRVDYGDLLKRGALNE